MKKMRLSPEKQKPEFSVDRKRLWQMLPRRDRIKSELRAFVLTLQPGAALPPITALRQQFKVSQHTIDRVVGDLRAEGLLKTRQRSGIYVVQPTRPLTIGILSEFNLFSRDSGFYGLLAMALHQCARPDTLRFRHYFFASSQDSTSYDQLQADARAGQLDGMLGLGTGGPHLEPLGVPYIDSADGLIRYDYPALVRLAVEALVVRGCRRLALFAHEPQVLKGKQETMRQESAAFQAAVAQAGVNTCADWMKPLRQRERDSRFWGYDEFTALWQAKGERPDGLVCVDDQATQGMLFAAERLGVAIPGEMLIASHANSLSPLPDPAKVIRVEFDTMAIAQGILARLQALVDGQATVSVPLQVSPQVVTRATPAAAVTLTLRERNRKPVKRGLPV